MCRHDDCWGLGDGEWTAVSVVTAPQLSGVSIS